MHLYHPVQLRNGLAWVTSIDLSCRFPAALALSCVQIKKIETLYSEKITVVVFLCVRETLAWYRT